MSLLGDTISAIAENKPDVYREVYSRIQEYLKGYEDRPSESIHVSNIWNECPRKRFLCRVFDKPDREPFDEKGRLTLDIGTAIHSLLQDKILIRHLFGDWQFPCGEVFPAAWWDELPGAKEVNQRVSEASQMVIRCGCEGRTHRLDEVTYKEISLRVPLVEVNKKPNEHYPKKFTLSGKVDSVVRILPRVKGEGFYNVIAEYKTINHKGYGGKERYGPSEGHVDQVNCYVCEWNRRASKSPNFPPVRHGVLVYIDKDQSEVQEFIVEPDEARYEACLAKARIIVTEREYFDSGIFPRGWNPLSPRICENERNFRARYCPVLDQCFNDHLVTAAANEWWERWKGSK